MHVGSQSFPEKRERIEEGKGREGKEVSSTRSQETSRQAPKMERRLTEPQDDYSILFRQDGLCRKRRKRVSGQSRGGKRARASGGRGGEGTDGLRACRNEGGRGISLILSREVVGRYLPGRLEMSHEVRHGVEAFPRLREWTVGASSLASPNSTSPPPTLLSLALSPSTTTQPPSQLPFLTPCRP